MQETVMKDGLIITSNNAEKNIMLLLLEMDEKAIHLYRYSQKPHHIHQLPKRVLRLLLVMLKFDTFNFLCRKVIP